MAPPFGVNEKKVKVISTGKDPINIKAITRVDWQGNVNLNVTELSMIEKHWKKLNGAPGKAISKLEVVKSGFRMKFEHGYIYARSRDNVVARVYGAIADKYDALNGPQSWLGFPLQDEAPFDEGGRVSVFEMGEIYFWGDTGAIEINEVAVHFTGIHCFGETDDDGLFTNSDEPYVVIGVISPGVSRSTTTPIFEDVDGGESVGPPNEIEIYRGKPYGINITSMLMEHDEEDPHRYDDAMKAAVATGFGAVESGLALIPYVGPGIAAAAAPFLVAVTPVVSKILVDALGLGDDEIGKDSMFISAKQLIVLSQKENSSFRGVAFKKESNLISGQGASYKVCFGIGYR